MPVLDAAPVLRGRRVLVVEDDFFLALELEEQLEAAGAIVVGPVPSIKDAALLLTIARRIDVALLDVNLGGELVYPLADQLTAMGVPLVFVTVLARHEMPVRFGGMPRCDKPVEMSRVVLAARAACGLGRSDASIPSWL
mgnify:CR=1 FL=1